MFDEIPEVLCFAMKRCTLQIEENMIYSVSGCRAPFILGKRKQKYDVPFMVVQTLNTEVDIAFHTDPSRGRIALWLSGATVSWTLNFYPSSFLSLSSPSTPPPLCLPLIFLLGRSTRDERGVFFLKETKCVSSSIETSNKNDLEIVVAHLSAKTRSKVRKKGICTRIMNNHQSVWTRASPCLIKDRL